MDILKKKPLYKGKHLKFTACLVFVAMTLLSGSRQWAFASSAVDDLVAPKLFIDPKNDDEWFFNMRNTLFLPESEPLLKETFGSNLKFESKAFWEYESYYSRAVAFATNLPTLAKIEYGKTTSYGMETTHSNSYYYQHLLHLTGLEPGTVYHYRIKVKGSDGAFLASGDYSFTTPELPGDIVKIPQDLEDKSLPYRLKGNDKKYLLTEDIHAPNGGIVLSGHNVSLDLGGHTIIYDNEPNNIMNENTHTRADLDYSEDATFGVRSGLWNFRNQKVFNGIIIQGANGGNGIVESGYTPFHATHVSDLEIAGLDVSYYGRDVCGIRTDDLSYVHHNIVNDRGSDLTNRANGPMAIYANGNEENRIEYNSVRRHRHYGIVSGGQKIGNEVYTDSFAGNSYAINSSLSKAIANNKIFALGFNPLGLGVSHSNAVIKDNFVYVHATPHERRSKDARDQIAIDRPSGIAGLRLFQYDGDPNVRTDNILIKNNVIICKAWPKASYIRALMISDSLYTDNLRIEDNIIKVEALTEDLNFKNVDYSYTCVDFSGSAGKLDTDPVVFTGNHFISNVSFLTSGSGYGVGRNGWFYDNTFTKINTNDTGYEPLRIGYWYYDSYGFKIMDSVLDGVDFTWPPTIGTNNTEPYLSIDIGVTSKRAYVDAKTGTPLANRLITWVTDSGETGEFTTGADGIADLEWFTTRNFHTPGNPAKEMTQVQNMKVTFSTEGYDDVTKPLYDLAKTGEPVQFGGSPEDANLVAEGLHGTTGLDAYTININFWTRMEFDGTEVYRANSASGPFELVGTFQGKPTYYDKGLSPDSTYFYKVRLFKDGSFGAMSESFEAKTGSIIAEDFKGSAGLDAYTISLSFWSRSEYDGAEIYRATSRDGNFELVQTAKGAPPYFDTGLEPDTVYYYKIRMYKGDWPGKMTDAIEVKTGSITAEDFKGSAGLDAYTISLSFWSRSEYDGAEIYRATSRDGNFELVQTAKGAPPYFDTSLEPDTVYYYKIRMYKGDWPGKMTDAIEVKTGSIIAEDFRGSASLDTNTVSLSFWSRSEYDGAEIYRATSRDGDFELVQTATGPPPYLDTELGLSTTYYYKIRLYKGSHFGLFTEVIELTTIGKMPKPTR
ncbi:MAG: hypothetical protein FWG10_09500 [Eubacteriaceae bacterium]|nr:hypothetical protein [Eubacteriaceae bacterium]